MEINRYEIINVYISYKEIKIPFYQRNYDWGKNEIYKLLDDVIKNKSDDYYLGTLIFKNSGSSIIIIDGQQRLTTLWLIRRCIYDVCIEHEEVVKKYFGDNVMPLEFIKKDQGLLFANFSFKSLNYQDGASLEEIIKNGLNNNAAISLETKENPYVKAYFLIKNYIEKSLSNLPDIINKFEKVLFTRIVIGPNDDEHILYSQINSTGKKLTAFDLIKNYLFSEIWNVLSFEQRKNDFDGMLKVFNKLFSSKKKDEIIKYFLSYKQEKFVVTKSDQIYHAFVDLSESPEYENNKLQLYKDLCNFCFVYNFAREKFTVGKKYEFNVCLEFLRDYFGAYTTLILDAFLTILDREDIDFKHEIIAISSSAEHIIFKTLKLIEIYIIRRCFCSISSKNSNRFIPTVVKKIRRNYYDNKEDYPNLLYTIFHEQSTENENATDDDLTTSFLPSFKRFYDNFVEAPIYIINSKFTKNFLIRLSRYISEKEDKNLDSYTVEHVMPQNLTKWIEDLNNRGISYNQSELEKYNQTIGNLTLTRYNSEFSNDSFSIKKEKMINKDGFVLNNYIRKQYEWNIETIKERSEELFKEVSDCWSFKDYHEIKNIQVLEEESKNIKLTKLIDVINKYHLTDSLTQQDLIFVIQNYLMGKSIRYIDGNILNIEYSDGEITQSIIDWLNIKGKKDLSSQQKIEDYISQYQADFDYLIAELNNGDDENNE